MAVGTRALSVHDAAATNLAEVLQFPARAWPPSVLGADGPFGSLSVPGHAAETDQEWLPLLQMAADFGWPIDRTLL